MGRCEKGVLEKIIPSVPPESIISFSIVLHCFTLFFSFDSGGTDGIIFSNTPFSHLTLFSLSLLNFICYPLYYVSIVLCFYCFSLIVYCSFVLLIIYALYVCGIVITDEDESRNV